MSKKFRTIHGKSCGYAIGELTSNVGYFLSDDGNVYSMGNNQKIPNDGWIFAGKADEDKVSLTCRYDEEVTDGIRMLSTDQMLEITQTSSKAKVGGYTLTLFTGGTWTWEYKFLGSEKNHKIIFYDAEHKRLCMGLYGNGKFTAIKEIGKGDFDVDFTIPFGQFHLETYDDPGEFIEDENSISSENDGPFIECDDKNETTRVGCKVDGEREGTVFFEFDDQIILRQYSSGTLEGPELIVFKDKTEWQYCVNEDGKESDIKSYVYLEDGAFEVRSYGYEDENLYDCLYIDSDFNVYFHEQFNDDDEEGINKIDYEFDEIIGDDSGDEDQDDEVEDEPEDEEDEEDKRPTIKLKKRSTRSDDSSSDDDIKNALRAIFKKKGKK